jgi:hypothetical protein
MADVWFAAQATPGLTSSVTTTANLSAGALSTNVSGLANAISSFNQGVSSPISQSLTTPTTTGASSTAPTGLLSANLVSTITALSQFNVNGQALGGENGVVTSQVPISLNSAHGMVSSTPTPLVIPNKKNSN